MPAQSNPLKDLQLLLVTWEGDDELWSLDQKEVICVTRDGTLDISESLGPIPHLEIDGMFEKQVVESKGGTYTGEAPTHDEVFEYLASHPEKVKDSLL